MTPPGPMNAAALINLSTLTKTNRKNGKPNYKKMNMNIFVYINFFFSHTELQKKQLKVKLLKYLCNNNRCLGAL